MAFKNPNIANSGKRRGRPPGSKTRPDAPSKLKQAKANGGTVPPSRAPRPSEIKTPVQNEPVNPIQSTAAPDTELFGSVKPAMDAPVDVGTDSIIPDEAPSLEQATLGTGEVPHESAPGGERSEAESNPPEPKASDSESQRPLVSLVIDSVLNFLATFIGSFWHPRPIGHGEGEVPYDERERLIVSGCRWFASMAIEALTPAQAFAMECFNYSLPRLKQTYDWFKLRFMKKAKPASSGETVNDPRMAGSTGAERNPGTGATVDIKTEVKPA